MKIALDPLMHCHLSLEDLPRKVRELGYDWIQPFRYQSMGLWALRTLAQEAGLDRAPVAEPA